MPFTKETIDKSNDFPALAMAIELYADLRDNEGIPSDRKIAALDEAYLLVEVLRAQNVNRPEHIIRPVSRAARSYTDRLTAIHESARLTCDMPRAALQNLDTAIAMLQTALWHIPCRQHAVGGL